MKLGVIVNYVFVPFSFDEMLDYVKSRGVEALELTTGNYHSDKFANPAELLTDTNKRRQFIKAIESRGLYISALTAHGNPLHSDPVIAERHHRTFMLTIDLAQTLGVPLVNGYSGMPGTPDSKMFPNFPTILRPPEYTDLNNWQWEQKVIPYWRQVGDYAAKKGIKIGIEAHEDFSVHSPGTLLKLRIAVGDMIGASLNASHLWKQLIDPVAAIHILASAWALFHVSTKDIAFLPDNLNQFGILNLQPRDPAHVRKRAWIYRTIGYGHSIEAWSNLISALQLVGFTLPFHIEQDDRLANNLEYFTKATGNLKELLLRRLPIVSQRIVPAHLRVSEGYNYISIYSSDYKIVILKKGFKYAFKKNDNTVVAGEHPQAGLRFSSQGGTIPHPAASTTFIAADDKKVQMLVINTNGDQAVVSIYPYTHYVKFEIVPVSTSNISAGGKYIIDASTSPLSPVYGLGDKGGYGNSTNVFGITDDNFHQTDVDNRFVSNFSIFPLQGFAQVLFEDGRKRVRINDRENTLGAADVDHVKKLYYFMGTMQQIYYDYKKTRVLEGYPDFKPKYQLFEVGYEAYGALGWNTYQQAIMNDIHRYLSKGYPLRWGVVGSGFWKGDRKADNQGATTSFGLWDDTYQPGRTDGLPNPRYPDVPTLKNFFRNNGMKLLLGLRINFKATQADCGYYNPVNDGPFPLEGLKNNYFMKDAQGNVLKFDVYFPKGKVYFIDGKNPDAVNWYKSGAELWGVDGFKEDTMLNPGSQLYNDAMANKTNEELMRSGSYMMIRNSAYNVPGELIRMNDTNYKVDKDRPAINGLNYAASGASNVYPDIVGGDGLTYPLTEDQKLYFIRNAMFAAVFPGMAMGFGPWNMQNPEYEYIVKKAVDWHSQFMPYIYSAAMASFHTGFPHTMTPLPIAFPDDINTYDLANKSTRQYEWMLGPSMLAAPAYGNDYATVNSRNVYLPAGRWIDYETGVLYHGPTTLLNHTIPADKIPIFIGGKGVVVFRDFSGTKLFAKVYPIVSGGSQYQYTYLDGSSVSKITNDNIGWNPRTIVILDTTENMPIHFAYEPSSGAFTFQLTPGHHYRLSGGI